MAVVEKRSRRSRAHCQAVSARPEASGKIISAFWRAGDSAFYGWRARLNVLPGEAMVGPTTQGAERAAPCSDLGTLGAAGSGPRELELETLRSVFRVGAILALCGAVTV